MFYTDKSNGQSKGEILSNQNHKNWSDLFCHKSIALHPMTGREIHGRDAPRRVLLCFVFAAVAPGRGVGGEEGN